MNPQNQPVPGEAPIRGQEAEFNVVTGEQVAPVEVPPVVPAPAETVVPKVEPQAQIPNVVETPVVTPDSTGLEEAAAAKVVGGVMPQFKQIEADVKQDRKEAYDIGVAYGEMDQKDAGALGIDEEPV